MRKGLLSLGVVLCVIGIGAIGASLMKGNLTFNLGDPAKFQFILVPIWLVGLGIAVLGALAILASRWVRGRAPAARS